MKKENTDYLSEEEYNGLLATAEIMSNQTLYEKIKDGIDTPLKDCVAEE